MESLPGPLWPHRLSNTPWKTRGLAAQNGAGLDGGYALETAHLASISVLIAAALRSRRLAARPAEPGPTRSTNGWTTRASPTTATRSPRNTPPRSTRRHQQPGRRDRAHRRAERLPSSSPPRIRKGSMPSRARQPRPQPPDLLRLGAGDRAFARSAPRAADGPDQGHGAISRHAEQENEQAAGSRAPASSPTAAIRMRRP